MLIDKIKEDINLSRKTREDINLSRKTRDLLKENILKLVYSESIKLNKTPEDNEVFKVLNNIFQSNYETLQLIKNDSSKESELNKLLFENEIINSYFAIDSKTVIDFINSYLNSIGKELEDLKNDKKSFGILMKNLNNEFKDSYNKLVIKNFLGI